MPNPFDAIVAAAEAALNNPTRARGVATTEADLKKAAEAEGAAREAHTAADLVARQTRERLENLRNMESPTQQSLVDEEATRRKLVKLDAKVAELAKQLEVATAHRGECERARNEARDGVTRAELDLEHATILRDAVAFDAEFRGRVLALQEKALPAQYAAQLTRLVVLPDDAYEYGLRESPLSSCIQRGRELAAHERARAATQSE